VLTLTGQGSDHWLLAKHHMCPDEVASWSDSLRSKATSYFQEATVGTVRMGKPCCIPMALSQTFERPDRLLWALTVASGSPDG